MYVGVCVGWFSVLSRMWIYVGVCWCKMWLQRVLTYMRTYVVVCWCMCEVVQCTEPYVGLCGSMWVYVDVDLWWFTVNQQMVQ